MKATLGAIATVAVLSSDLSSAWAQGNDRSAPTGGRSALMGNTGVALARDGAAPFLNPATVVAINDQHLAFSVNFFTYSVTHYGRWNQPGTVDTGQFGDVGLNGTGDSSTRFHGLPSTLCLFLNLGGAGVVQADDEGLDRSRLRGRQKLALCLGNLESEQVDLTALSFQGRTPAGSTVEVESISRSWNRLYVGPTYSFAVTDDFAVGASLHGVVTSSSFDIEESNVTSVTGGAVQGELDAAGYGYSFDLAPTFGATYRVGRVTLGASAQVPALHLFGRYNATSNDDSETMQGPDTANVTTGSGRFSVPPLGRLAIGAGAQWPRLTLEVDEALDFSWAKAMSTSMVVDVTDLSSGTPKSSSSYATYSVASRPMLNTSAGAEYFVSKTLSLIGGISTNLSAISPLAPATGVGNLVQAHANHVAVSFGLGSYGQGGYLLFGAQLDYGWGDALVANPYVLPNQWSEASSQIFSATLVLAGATNLRAIGHAIEKVERAVTTGNPESTAPPPVPIPGANPPSH
jgi:hypothetical protein